MQGEPCQERTAVSSEVSGSSRKQSPEVTQKGTEGKGGGPAPGRGTAVKQEGSWGWVEIAAETEGIAKARSFVWKFIGSCRAAGGDYLRNTLFAFTEVQTRREPFRARASIEPRNRKTQESGSLFLGSAVRDCEIHIGPSQAGQGQNKREHLNAVTVLSI